MSNFSVGMCVAAVFSVVQPLTNHKMNVEQLFKTGLASHPEHLKTNENMSPATASTVAWECDADSDISGTSIYE